MHPLCASTVIVFMYEHSLSHTISSSYFYGLDTSRYTHYLPPPSSYVQTQLIIYTLSSSYVQTQLIIFIYTLSSSYVQTQLIIYTLPSSVYLQTQLVGAAGMLSNGIEIIRMRSRKTLGCGTFKDCQHGGIHLDAKDPMERMRNWYVRLALLADNPSLTISIFMFYLCVCFLWCFVRFSFYCKGHKGSEKYVADCLDTPYFRCFTR